MVKILRIINRFNVGGPVNNALYLSKYLSPQFQTKLIGGIPTKDEISAEFMFDELDVPIEKISEMTRSINLIDDYKAYKRICKIIEAYRPDIIHTHASKAGLIGRLAGIRYKTPIIVHTFHGHVFHSYFGKLKTLLFLNIERFLAKHSNKIVTISPLQKEELYSKYKIAPKHKFEVIPLGFDLLKFTENQKAKRARFRQKYQIDDNSIVISIIGRLVPIKNHRLFIESIAQLKNICQKSIKVFVVGDGDLKAELISLSKELGLEISSPNHTKDITFTSWLKETDQVYAGSDIIALSSKNEGTPVTLIEAQVALKPIVSTDVGGIKDILVPSIFNTICEANPSAFAKALQSTINHLKNKRPEEFIRQETLAKYNFTNLANNTEKMYLNLISQNNA